MNRIAKKLLSVFTATSLLVACLGLQGIHAESDTTLRISSNQHMHEYETTQINYYTDSARSTLVGSVWVYIDNDVILKPNIKDGDAVYDLNTLSGNQVTVVWQPSKENGYRVPDKYNFGNNQMPVGSSDTTQIILTITSKIENMLSFDFVQDNGGNSPASESKQKDNPSEPMVAPIVAKFSDIDEEVEMNKDGYILIPDGWTSGTVTFKAKIFRKSDGTIEAYKDQTINGKMEKEKVAIEGIANLDEIKNTASAIASGKPNEFGDRVPAESVTISEGFFEYGKLQLHIVHAEGSNLEVNQLLNVVSNNMINITANAHLVIRQSFGTIDINQAIITKDEPKDVKIFFGNTETTLVVSGNTVDKITAVEGGKGVDVHVDGTATVTLPGSSTETTTPVKVTILKKDKSTITRTVNIVRTAIQLQHNYGGGDDTVYAGYVVNKGYLYNNQDHNDAIFNAYLQVILYKDNVVAGYKQIKIDDEVLINGLKNNESGSLELYSPQQIAVYGKEADGLIDGVNKVSVFLTNGPIDFNGDTLPSVEFGIGSGVTCEWEALS